MLREEFVEQMHDNIEDTLDRLKIICPMPDYWARFHQLGVTWIEETVTKEELLKSFGHPAFVKDMQEVPNFDKDPLFLQVYRRCFPRALVMAGWWDSADNTKRNTFVKQLEFLREHRLLGKACLYLLTIPTRGYGWYRYGDFERRLNRYRRISNSGMKP